MQNISLRLNFKLDEITTTNIKDERKDFRSTKWDKVAMQ